jgi:hypothetical protein
MSKIEDIFKSSLENYEVSYNPEAWNNISNKLDNQVKHTHKFSSTKKWGLASIVVLAASVGLIYTNSATRNQTITKSTLTVKSNEGTKSTVQKNKKNITANNQSKPTLTKTTHSVSKPTTKTISIPLVLDNKNTNELTEIKNNKSQNTEPSKQIKTTITFSATAKEMYCLGETEILTNENNYAIYLINEHNKVVKFDPNEKQKITFNQLGEYYWSRENHLSTKEKMHAFTVKETTFLNFNLPTNLDYNDGLPMLITSTSSNQSAKWFVNNKYISDDNQLRTALFNKGTYEISAQIINENGCKSETSKTFDVDQNYNLLSVTGFEPLHSDQKRNVFLPFALKTRNTPFRMIIIDPTSNQTIFETNDINTPWDGINQITNQLVPVNSQFLWKVTLLSPEKNERNEYRGIITRI